jgi:peptide chain release factor subunit 1
MKGTVSLFNWAGSLVKEVQACARFIFSPRPPGPFAPAAGVRSKEIPMLNDSSLRELLDYTSPDPVLSVYLNTDITESTWDQVKLRLRALLKGIDLPEDQAAILEYIERERKWIGRGLAMFSCAPQKYFRAYSFAVPLHSRAFVGSQPYVKPLADLLDAYGDYGVALVDQQAARLFFFHLGRLQEQEEVLGEEVHHTKRGGASTFPGRRGGVAGVTHYMEETVERNLKDAVQSAVPFFEQNHVRRVLIGGTEENVSEFRGHLPKAWQKQVVGTFQMDISANPNEVLKHVLEIGREFEQQHEAELVEEMITMAAKGATGVLGLDETLAAARAGNIKTLLVNEGYRAAGFRCLGCGYLTAQALETCPFCGKHFEEITDAVELAIRLTLQQGADVEIVRENPEMAETRIGALLRY